ncbi:MAG: hypothetical protein Q8O67_01760 [Deltaproteobacteria bacterium]|nr:hypothetical protein [Deltaproteobacteria bacterium]
MMSPSSRLGLIVVGVVLLIARGALWARREIGFSVPSGLKVREVPGAALYAPFPREPDVSTTAVAVFRPAGKREAPTFVDVVDARASHGAVSWRVWSGPRAKLTTIAGRAYDLAREQLPDMQLTGKGPCFIAQGADPETGKPVVVDGVFAFDDDHFWLLSVMRPVGTPGRETNGFFLNAERVDSDGRRWFLLDEETIELCQERRDLQMVNLAVSPAPRKP